MFAKDERVRRLVENKYVELFPKGSQAVASHLYIADPERADAVKIKEKMIAEKFDGLLIARPVPAGEQLTFVDPAINPTAFYGMYSYYAYWTASYRQVVASGSVRDEGEFKMDTKVYSLTADTLVWMGVSRPMETSSMKLAVEDYVMLIVDKLVSQDLLKN